MTMPEPERLLTTEEIAAILSVHPRTVMRWLREGKLKGLKVGRLWRVRLEDLEAFIRGEKGGESDE